MVRSFVRSFVHPCEVRIHSVRFGQLLRCAINTIPYDSVKNKIANLFTFTFAKLGISPPTR